MKESGDQTNEKMKHKRWTNLHKKVFHSRREPPSTGPFRPPPPGGAYLKSFYRAAHGQKRLDKQQLINQSVAHIHSFHTSKNRWSILLPTDNPAHHRSPPPHSSNILTFSMFIMKMWFCCYYIFCLTIPISLPAVSWSLNWPGHLI